MEIGQKIKNTFKDLKFDEEKHRYTVKGNSFESVSNLIKEFTPKFDSKTIAGYVAKSQGVSRKEILKSWKDIKEEACNFGTRVHNFGERYASNKYGIKTEMYFKSVNQHLEEGEELSPKEKALVKFWEDMPDYIVPIILEFRMYSEEWEYAGTADLIFIDTRDNTLIIGDYKTNKDLYKQYKNQKLLDMFSFLDDTPLSKYEIQLSYYEILLRQTGYKVSRRFVVWLKEDATYEIINTRDFTEKLIEVLHKNKIDASW